MTLRMGKKEVGGWGGEVVKDSIVKNLNLLCDPCSQLRIYLNNFMVRHFDDINMVGILPITYLFCDLHTYVV